MRLWAQWKSCVIFWLWYKLFKPCTSIYSRSVFFLLLTGTPPTFPFPRFGTFFDSFTLNYRSLSTHCTQQIEPNRILFVYMNVFEWKHFSYNELRIRAFDVCTAIPLDHIRQIYTIRQTVEAHTLTHPPTEARTHMYIRYAWQREPKRESTLIGRKS